MKRLYFLFAFATIVACNSTRPIQSFTGDIKKDLNNLLPEGVLKVDVMGVKQNPRAEELMVKFKEGIKNNQKWFIDFSKTATPKKPMKYHPNLGVTKEEFMELQNYLDKIELIPSIVSYINIKKQDDIIHFKSGGKLSLLNSIMINLKTKKVMMGKYQLSFSDTLNITDEKNALKSKWKGYQWSLEEPKNANLNTFKDLQNLNVIQYKFTIGQLEKSGKTYISIKGREFADGYQKINFEIPMIF